MKQCPGLLALDSGPEAFDSFKRVKPLCMCVYDIHHLGNMLQICVVMKKVINSIISPNLPVKETRSNDKTEKANITLYDITQPQKDAGE